MEVDQLTGQQVVLKSLHQSYIDEYLDAFSPIVRAQLYVDSLKAERAYLMDQLEQQQKGNTIFYCVFDRTSHQLIGAVELRGLHTSCGQLYCWLHEQFWGSGYFQQALALAARAYFIKTDHSLLNAHVDSNNKRSYYALKNTTLPIVASSTVHVGCNMSLFYAGNRPIIAAKTPMCYANSI